MTEKQARQIIKDLQEADHPNHQFVKRNAAGHKLLTLSYRPEYGFRYFKGKKPGGGGRKHTPCAKFEALALLMDS